MKMGHQNQSGEDASGADRSPDGLAASAESSLIVGELLAATARRMSVLGWASYGATCCGSFWVEWMLGADTKILTWSAFLFVIIGYMRWRFGRLNARPQTVRHSGQTGPITNGLQAAAVDDGILADKRNAGAAGHPTPGLDARGLIFLAIFTTCLLIFVPNRTELAKVLAVPLTIGIAARVAFRRVDFRSARQALRDLRGKSAADGLAGAVKVVNDWSPEISQVARAEIARMLEQSDAKELHAVQPDQMRRVYGLLSFRDPLYLDAVLKAIERTGDCAALSYLRRLQRTPGGAPADHARVYRAIQTLEQLSSAHEVARTSLRPSASTEATGGSAELLRGTADPEANELMARNDSGGRR